MTSSVPKPHFTKPRRTFSSFRHAIVRGLALLLPPLLTIVIFLWVGNTVKSYLLEPLVRSAQYVLVDKLADIRTSDGLPPSLIVDGVTNIDGKKYHVTDDKHLIPEHVYNEVKDNVGKDAMPQEAKQIYRRYVNETWLQWRIVVPVFLCVFVLLLYLFGKFLAAGIGRFFWNQLERIIDRVPLVRNVYSSVKQITDFLFTEPDVQYTRVVAIEYPRKGVWQLAFVTGDGFLDVRTAAKEPVVAVFVPHSPIPLTGFCATVKKSETVDLSITVDQAIQFIVSCGVVVPPEELADSLAKKVDNRKEPQLALSATGPSDE